MLLGPYPSNVRIEAVLSPALDQGEEDRLTQPACKLTRHLLVDLVLHHHSRRTAHPADAEPRRDEFADGVDAKHSSVGVHCEQGLRQTSDARGRLVVIAEGEVVVGIYEKEPQRRSGKPET